VTAALETRDLSVRFGGLKAVDGISVTVEDGRVLGVIGPNGAGKSTFINLITGQIRPTRGKVLVGGRDLTGAKPWKIAAARVARTFQINKPFRGLSVRDNVAIGAMFGAPGGGSVAKARGVADEVLERLGLSGVAELGPTELSVAHAQRLEVAKALALRPRVLFLDEAMAGLRPAEMEPQLELIRELRREGLAIVVVEHVMRAIRSVCDTVLVMQEGRELLTGPPDEVLADERVITAYLGQRYADRQRAERAEAGGSGPAVADQVGPRPEGETRAPG